MRFSEKESNIIAFIVSGLLHVAILGISIPKFIDHQETNQVIRVPVQMKVRAEVKSPQAPKRVAKSKKKQVAKVAKKKVKSVQKNELQGETLTPITVKDIMPIYPKQALNNEWQGTVVVDIELDKNGIVKDVRLVQSTGHSLLDRNFIRTLKQYYQLEASKVAGKKVAGSKRISYSYTL